ncbi:MAG TPA: hypothetical protein VGG19_01010 [Tepidisphaeraceae bacterium]|jgi:Spy/CpxP family protein refolding chaperone
MTKTTLTILLGFLLMFAAGAVVGMVQSKAVFGPPPPHDRSWLAEQLQLTNAQKQQIQQIWADSMPRNREQAMEQRHALQKQRNDAIRTLLTPAQLAQFEKIEQQYETASSDLQKERGKAVQEAIAKTKLILNDEQRAKYEEILKRHDGEHAGWDNAHHPSTFPG